MKLSVIISCYSAENIISSCLRSLQNQTYDNIEIIVVDANSPDRTVEIIKTSFPFVNLVEEDRVGVGQALNIGMKHATGDIIVIDFNTDEVANKYWAEKLIQAHHDADDNVIISPARLRPDGRVSAYGLRLRPNGAVDQIGYGEIYNPTQPSQECDATGMNTFPRALIEEIGYVDENYEFYGADVDFSIRARYAGYKVVTAPAAYTTHQRSYSKAANKVTYFKRMNYGIMRFAAIHGSPSTVMKSIAYYGIFMPFLALMKIIANLITNGSTEEHSADLRGRIQGSLQFLAKFSSNYPVRKRYPQTFL